MTNKELYDEIYEMQDKYRIILYGNDVTENVIDALGKQISKRVVDYHHCPTCGGGLPAKGITDDWCSCCFNWNYCPDCGQRLKWED